MLPNKDELGPTRSRDDAVVPLLREEVVIGKRQVATGKVRIQTVSDSFEEIASATLQEEQVTVTRVPIDRVVTKAPAVRTENGVTIVPVLEEVMIVEKRLVLREELHIRRDVSTQTVEVPVRLRRQRALVERIEDPALKPKARRHK
jgi:stress response protein YsnF